jgi:Holliday junction DNA helicase RuvA
MFYYIKGKLVFTDETSAVIDVGGVAYSMTVSTITLRQITSGTLSGADDVLLYTHLSVREDGIELFGFNNVEELNMFKLLITVSGVGPKAAMSLLSFMPPENISSAIYRDDKKTISKASGIGPKTAARIILELKDKVADNGNSTQSSDTSDIYVASTSSGKFTEALDALTVLGFSRNAADDALKKVDVVNPDIEDIIKAALSKLMK